VAAVIHYHGVPINPEAVAALALDGGHAFVSFSDTAQLPVAATVCQSFALDNGAFSAWRGGSPVVEWEPFYTWARECLRIPSCDFAVIPDVIDGDERANDALLAAWPLPQWFGAPVWHLHESVARLRTLVSEWPRVCIGSSGEFARIKTARWWGRMAEAMRAACDESGRPLARLHGLRMLDPEVFTRFPFASADSTNIARNVGIDLKWRGTYVPATKEARAVVLRGRIEKFNAPARFNFAEVGETLEQACLLW
jgi:hypothetical protein